jgi:hypothetical protein
MFKYIKDTDRQARSMKTPISHPASSSLTKPLLVEPTKKVGENTELDRLWKDKDDDSDNSNDEDENGENPVLKFVCETASSTAMDIEVDNGVDIGVLQLHNYLSDHLAMLPLVDDREGSNTMKKAACLSVSKVFKVQDMMF